jgi:opacity protein-like surface antigen
MKQLIACLALLTLSLTVGAQDAPEYRLELGAGVGVATYQGDFNSSLLKNMNPLGGVVLKYKPNPRMAWAANVGYGRLKGNSKKADTWYPDIKTSTVEFKTGIVDVNVRFEYNFWPFGTGREYHGARRLTPFLAIGLGLVFASYDTTLEGVQDKGSSAAGQMPVGFGVKYKVADRWNLAAEWMMHFTGNDKLDGISDPYGIKSTGLFKNTDCYSTIGVTLTYDLWAKCKTCHNDRE